MTATQNYEIIRAFMLGKASEESVSSLKGTTGWNNTEARVMREYEANTLSINEERAFERYITTRNKEMKDEEIAEYLSDTEIEARYKDFEIEELNVTARYVVVFLPHNDPDLVQTITDNFMIYSDGAIAFDHWYPESVTAKLKEEICNAINR